MMSKHGFTNLHKESIKRKSRTVVSLKNKTTAKKLKAQINDYFVENCQSLGTESVI